MNRAKWLSLSVVLAIVLAAVGGLYLYGARDAQTKQQLAAMQQQLEAAKKKGVDLEQAKQRQDQARKSAGAKPVAEAEAAKRLAEAKAAAERAAAERAAADKLAAEKAALDAERARMAAEKVAAERAAAAEKALAPSASAQAVAAGASSFQVAQNLEGEGRGREAIKAYIAAARGGSCEAARRLGEIYDKGVIGVSRDYAESLKWYNFARSLGTCDVPLRDSGRVFASAPPSAAPAAPVSLERYPTIESPDAVRPAQKFVVQVSLTEARVTPDVAVHPAPGSQHAPPGGITLRLPGEPVAWTIDVVLTARGFSFVDGSNVGRITLPRQGDSTPAAFDLRPDPSFRGPTERRIYATLSHEGQYLARISKPIRVADDSDAAALAVRSAVPVEVWTNRRGADLTLVVLDQADAGKTATSEVIVLSPFLPAERETVIRAAGAEAWIAQHYQKIMQTVAEVSDVRLGERTIPLLDGFGAQLYDEFAPSVFRRAYVRLEKARGAQFQSIQIITNNPALPWELMRPLGADGKREDFLGVTRRLARWHLVSNGQELPAPVQAIALNEVVAIAPRYKGAESLDGQTRELDALRKLRGARVVDGRLRTVSRLFEGKPAGIVHFAGHGAATKTASGLFDYAIQLEDATLDVTSWRGLARGPIASGALVFFNACEIGQASRVARFVEGWAPALIEAGASGYIGGLWPLTDAGATEFAVRFYSALAERTGADAIVVSELMRQNRRLFRETGDPTFLAYVLYGDVNLRIDRR